MTRTRDRCSSRAPISQSSQKRTTITYCDDLYVLVYSSLLVQAARQGAGMKQRPNILPRKKESRIELTIFAFKNWCCSRAKKEEGERAKPR